MKKNQTFYNNLIEIESVHIALDELNLSPDEKEELVIIINNSLHHSILDAVLSELSEEDKKQFLSLVYSEKHQEIWDLLSKTTTGIESKIKKAAEDLKLKLHEDIKEAKKRA